MTKRTIMKAMKEAREFITRANALLTDHEASQFMEYSGNSKTGSLRRQSMELTRALAEMRKVAR